MKKYKFKINKDENCQCGSLIAIEQNRDIPFEIKRVFYIYEVSSTIKRGTHAHKYSNQVLICLKGSCKITLDDGAEKQSFVLNSPDEGLYQPKLVWGEMEEFSEDALLLVLSDSLYDKNDYIYDYNDFLKKAIK